MSSILHSISGALYRGVVRAVEPEESVRMRKTLETRYKNQAIDYRTACISILSVGTITALGLLLVSPVASLVVLGITAAGAYFTESFASYFDNLKKIFQDPANFVLSSNQTKEELIDHIFNEQASANTPFFVRALVENNTTAHWIL